MSKFNELTFNIFAPNSKSDVDPEVAKLLAA